MLRANSLHVVSVSEQVRSLAWADSVVNRGRYLFTPNAINDALALRIQTPKPKTELFPSLTLV
jgi:hypothetical protein